MRQSTKTFWVKLITSGLGVALLTFVANKAWEVYQHRNVGPKYVDASIRFEDNKLLVFLRNNSDEPLDLARAKIALEEPGLVSGPALGAYPDVTKIYTVTPTSGSAILEVMDTQLVVTLQITQAIKPKEADHFGIALTGLLGPVDLSKAKIRAEFEDLKGNKYVFSR